MNILKEVIVVKICMYDDDVSECIIRPYKHDLLTGEVDFYWFDNYQKCSSTIVEKETPSVGEMTIIKSYGEIDENDDNWWDNVNIDFLRTFHPLTIFTDFQSVEGTLTGWLSPSGDFYRCYGSDHDTMAVSIFLEEYNDLLEGIHARENLLYNSWLIIREEGYIQFNEFSTPTQDQRNAIEKIREIGKDTYEPYWLENLNICYSVL